MNKDSSGIDKSTEPFFEMLSNLSVPVALFRPDGTCTFSNPSLRLAFTLDSRETITLSRLIPENYVQALHELQSGHSIQLPAHDSDKFYRIKKLASLNDNLVLSFEEQLTGEPSLGFRNIFDQLSIAVTILRGEDLVFEYANSMALKILNRIDHDILGKKTEDVFPELKDQGFIELLKHVFATGEQYVGKETAVVFQHNNIPETYYLNFIYQRFLSRDGKPEGIMVVATDLTRQVIARKEAERREFEFQKLADAMPQLVWITNAEGRVTYYNSKVKEFYGASLMEDGTWSWNGLIHPDDFERTAQKWNKALSSSHVYEIEHRVQMADGEYRWFLSRGVPYADPSGQVVNWIGTATDIHTLKTVEEKLRYAATITQNLSDAVVGTDNEFRIMLWNEGAEAIYGWKQEEVLGKKTRDILTTIYSSEETELNAIKTLTDTGLWKGEVMQRRRNGDLIHIMSSVNLLKDKDGKVIGAVGINRDISKLVSLTESLSHQKQLLESVTSNATLALFMMDEHQHCIYMNEAAESMTGFSFQEVQGKQLHYFIHHHYPDGRPYPLEECPIDQALPKQRQMKGEEMFIRKDGAFYPVAFTASPIHFNGKAIGTVIEVRDITEDKRRVSAIEDSEKKFRTLTESLPQLIWMSDDEGNFVYTSSQWKSQTGIQPADMDDLQKLIHKDDLLWVNEVLIKGFRTGKPYRFETRLKEKSGFYEWHYVHGEPLKNDNGKVTNWIGAFTNINDQKNLNEKLEQLIRERTLELRRSNEDLLQFAHVTSHDLKEPVRKISTFANLLTLDEDNILSEKSKGFLKKIELSSQRMYDMIDGVLKYSSLSSSTEVFNERVSVNAIIDQILVELEVIVQEKEAVLNVEKSLPLIKGSQTLLYQLFYNLIVNALKFSSTNSAPVIGVKLKSQSDSFVEIVVEDNGIGFDPEYAEVIFRTFTRLHSKDKYEGTGLGLSLCKKIVERHGGRITATSDGHHGAQFTVMLPVFLD